MDGNLTLPAGGEARTCRTLGQGCTFLGAEVVHHLPFDVFFSVITVLSER